MRDNEFDYAVIGGGLVGSCIAYGLSRQSSRVAVLDEGDRALRASRGNFGLVWVQSKGWDFPAYARWTGFAAGLWPEFSQTLCAATGVNVDYKSPGGLEFCIDAEDWQRQQSQMQKIQQFTNGSFEFEMLENAAIKKRIPEVSAKIAGASYCPHDGHVNPLSLLRALHQYMEQSGVSYLPNRQVASIETVNGGFRIATAAGVIEAGKVVLCAGLGNARLGKMVGLNVPVKPNRGQLLITEKVKQFLNYPTLQVRQTTEGGLQIGDSAEDAGFDDHTSIDVMQMLAARAVKILPMLAHIRIVRAWAALRVMTPDGKPVYQQSQQCAGAYAIACHSGVTLAAAHCGPVAEWIAGSTGHPLIAAFTTERFNV